MITTIIVEISDNINDDELRRFLAECIYWMTTLLQYFLFPNINNHNKLSILLYLK